VSGVSEEIFSCGKEAIFNSYENGITDEFLIPKVKENYPGLKDNDSLIFLNFRKDRPRQITKALIEKDFKEFSRKEEKNIYFLSMTRYYKEQKSPVIFEDEVVENTLGEILENAGKTQLRIAETEKFAHVTFFFDGGVKKDFSGKKEILIPSPAVATYDLKPEMSAREVTEKLISEMEENKPDFILVNYANTDMVGHTGKFEAIKKAVEVVDECVGKVVEKGRENDYSILLTADHGNVDDKRKATLTTHTINPVPLTLIADDEKIKEIDLEKIKGLADIKGIILK
jgi:2,3-bisphosphoglycerate-independent phosphoglycerate mutase